MEKPPAEEEKEGHNSASKGEVQSQPITPISTSGSSSTMEKIRFPPPATWYKTNATAARDDMWAYLSGQTIVLVTPKVTHTLFVKGPGEGSAAVGEGVEEKEKDIWPTFKVFGSQKDNFSCLSFCQSAMDFLPVKGSPLVTGCNQGYVRVWNVESGQCVAYHDIHREPKEIPVTCVDWSVRNPKVIYSMDEEGHLVSCYLPKQKLKKFQLGKFSPSTLHASPHEDNVIAFGTKGGVIFIVQTDPIGNGGCRILNKVRHDEEVVATLWCPKTDWRFSRQEANDKGPMLASSIQSVKPPTIRLWGKNLEDKGVYSVWEKDKSNHPKKAFRNFCPLAWVLDPNTGLPLLLTSSRNGEIVLYSSGCTLTDFVHGVHSHSSIFGLVQCGDILWSTSYEPVIVGWNLRTMAVSCVIPTFKGICAIAPSPSVGSLIGFGGTDAYIRVVNFHQNYPLKDPVKAPNVSFRMQSKIMALAWHPHKDNWIGFGTDDGVLGYFELRDNNQKHSFQFQHRVGGVVYSVDWGPSTFSKDFVDENGEKKKADLVSLSLYACGGSKIVSVHPSKMDNKLIDVGKIIHQANLHARVSMDSESFSIRAKAADIRWSPDYALFAVGYNEGRVELYSAPHLQLKCWIKCHTRAIQFLNWRLHDFNQKKIDPEHKERWFATASNDATVRIFNLEKVFQEEFLFNDDEQPQVIIDSAATLRGPGGGIGDRIISTAWSQHDPSLIATVSYDSTSIVWNIKDARPIARYMGHSHRLVACSFHPTSPFKLLTASDEFTHDCTVHVWDYRDHPYSDRQVSCKEISTNYITAIHIRAEGQESKDKDKIEVVEEMKVTKSNPVKKDDSSRVHVIDPSVIPDNRTDAGKKQSKGKGKSKSLVPSTANAFINTKNTLEAEIRYLVESPKSPPKQNGGTPSSINDGLESVQGSSKDLSMAHLGLLGDFGQCTDLMQLECKSHAEKGDFEKGCLLASWMGDTGFVEKAVNEGYVTETVIILAKTLSKPLYNKACEVYARKLIQDDEICKGATYLMHAGLKEEAIRVLLDNKLFRDAVLMMKICTLTKNPIQNEVMKTWLTQLILDGNFEVAAKVYASLKMYQDAAEVMERRETPYAWKTGMYLSDKCGNVLKMEVFALKFCVNCIVKAEYEEAKQVLNSYSHVKWLLPFVHAHEIVFHLSNKLRDASKDPDESGKTEVTFKLREVFLEQLNLSDFDGKKLKDTIVVSIAQNRSDAEIMLTRTLVLILLEDSAVNITNAKEEYMKLCDVWLKEQAPFLHNAFAVAFNSLA